MVIAMTKLFNEYDNSLIEKFEIIFDRAQNETTAKSRAVDFYLTLVEEGKDVDTQEIIDSAEAYGYDFSDFEELVEESE
jgi:hypothetical protein